MIDLNDEPTALPDPTNLGDVLGFTTEAAFKMAVENGAAVAEPTNAAALKIGNTELPSKNSELDRIASETIQKREEIKNERIDTGTKSNRKTGKSVQPKSGTKGNGKSKKVVNTGVQRGNKKAKSRD